MFGLDEKITFSIQAYNETENLITSLIIPKELNYDFKLPENTSKVELIECNGFTSVKTILTIYLAEVKTIKELMETNKKIILDLKIDERMITTDTKLIAILRDDDQIEVKKAIKDNEIAFSALEQIENYIRKLSKEISKFERSTNKVRKLINITH